MNMNNEALKNKIKKAIATANDRLMILEDTSVASSRFNLRAGLIIRYEAQKMTLVSVLAALNGAILKIEEDY